MAVFISDVLMKSVVSNLSLDSANRKYLMQKLRVMDSEIELPIKKMVTAKHATTNLSFALDAYARKLIGDDTLQAIRMSCEVFSKLHTSTTLEEKFKELEKLFEDKLQKVR